MTVIILRMTLIMHAEIENEMGCDIPKIRKENPRNPNNPRHPRSIKISTRIV